MKNFNRLLVPLVATAASFSLLAACGSTNPTEKAGIDRHYTPIAVPPKIVFGSIQVPAGDTDFQMLPTTLTLDNITCGEAADGKWSASAATEAYDPYIAPGWGDKGIVQQLGNAVCSKFEGITVILPDGKTVTGFRVAHMPLDIEPTQTPATFSITSKVIAPMAAITSSN